MFPRKPDFIKSNTEEPGAGGASCLDTGADCAGIAVTPRSYWLHTGREGEVSGIKGEEEQVLVRKLLVESP